MSDVATRLLALILFAVGSLLPGAVPSPTTSPSTGPVASGSPPTSPPASFVAPALAPGLDASHPPKYRPSGPPTGKATQRGVRVELWVDDKTLEQGQWLKLHVRITNLRHTSIRRFCDGIGWDIDTSSIFAPGATWTGVAGTFKEHWMREHPLVIIQDAFTDYRPRKQGCGGDAGQHFQQPPGGVIEQTVVGMPRYQLADQPLPGGTFTVAVGFQPGIRGRPQLAEVSVPVTLAGGPVDYPAPGSLVDAALATPGFIEFLEHTGDPRRWANTTASFWSPPYPVQPRFDPARQAPQGILEIALFADAPDADGYGEVIVDPWTGQSFGFQAG